MNAKKYFRWRQIGLVETKAKTENEALDKMGKSQITIDLALTNFLSSCCVMKGGLIPRRLNRNPLNFPIRTRAYIHANTRSGNGPKALLFKTGLSYTPQYKALKDRHIPFVVDDIFLTKGTPLQAISLNG